MEGNIEIRAKTENKLFPEGTDRVFFYSDKEKNKQYSQNMQLPFPVVYFSNSICWPAFKRVCTRKILNPVLNFTR